MSHTGGMEIDFANGTYRFRLTMNGLIEIEKECNLPIMDVLIRLNTARYGTKDIREIIRWGLIGGGLDDVKALNLVRTYVDDVDAHPLHQHYPTALAILHRAIIGFSESPLVQEAPEPTISPDASTPEPSMPRPTRSVSNRETSMTSPSGSGPRWW